MTIDRFGIIEQFKFLQPKEEMEVPLSMLHPTQLDDGFTPWRTSHESPMEVSLDGDRLIVMHGNHRYYEKMRDTVEEVRDETMVRVKKAANPYTEW